MRTIEALDLFPWVGRLLNFGDLRVVIEGHALQRDPDPLVQSGGRKAAAPVGLSPKPLKIIDSHRVRLNPYGRKSINHRPAAVAEGVDVGDVVGAAR